MAKSTIPGGKKYEFEKNHVFQPIRCGEYLLHQITEVLAESDHAFGEHLQWCYEITYVISGTGKTLNDGTAYDISAGDVFVTPVGAIHEMVSLDGLRFLCVGFEMDGECASPEVSGIKSFFDAPPEQPVRGSERIKSLIQDALDDQFTLPLYHEYALGMFIGLLCVYVCRCFEAAKRSRYFANDSARIMTLRLPLYSVVLYIDTNVSEIRSVASLASRLGYSPCYLSHVFSEGMGMTLQQYIAERRIHEAIKLRTKEGLSLSAVASQVGFETTQAFSKTFKRVTGMSPREYFTKAENT